MKGTKNPISIIKSAIYRKKHKREMFPYCGIEVYFGKYGSGKTIAVVNKVYDILEKYPKCIFITNTAITRSS